MRPIRWGFSGLCIAALGVAGCDLGGGENALDVQESREFRRDQIVGILSATSTDAYFLDGDRKVRLIHAAPIGAMGSDALMAQTALRLREWSGQRVQARGELQGDILWSAEVTSVQPRRQAREWDMLHDAQSKPSQFP